MVTKQDIDNLYPRLLGRTADAGAYGYVGKSFHDFIYDLVQSAEFQARQTAPTVDKQLVLDYVTKNLN